MLLSVSHNGVGPYRAARDRVSWKCCAGLHRHVARKEQMMTFHLITFSVCHGIPRGPLRSVVYQEKMAFSLVSIQSQKSRPCSHFVITMFFFSGRLLNHCLQVPLRKGTDICM